MGSTVEEPGERGERREGNLFCGGAAAVGWWAEVRWTVLERVKRMGRIGRMGVEKQGLNSTKVMARLIV